ncbi:MAG: DMT family transporter [Planctomycetes bacterium]|nr:DMT family transporter [Planctomycetota bacterium]
MSDAEPILAGPADDAGFRHGRTSRSGIFGMLGAWVLWSMDPILIHMIGPTVQRSFLVAIALIIGGLSMMVSGHGAFKRILTLAPKHLLLLAVLVVLSTAGAELLYVSAIAIMNPGLVGVLLRSQVAFAVILAMVFLGERFGKVTAWGIIVILAANVGWLGYNLSHSGTTGSLLGWALAIGAAVLWSLGTITAKSLVNVLPPNQLVVARLTLGGLLMLIVSLGMYGLGAIGQITPAQWVLLVTKGVFTSGITFFLYFWALRRLRVYVASALEQVAPLATLFVAHFWLRQTVTWHDVVFVGVLLVGAAIVIVGGDREILTRILCRRK